MRIRGLLTLSGRSHQQHMPEQHGVGQTEAVLRTYVVFLCDKRWLNKKLPPNN